MKKKYIAIKGANRWNNLLKKFEKIQKRLESLTNVNSGQYTKLVSKLKLTFSRLEKMQFQTGLKLAGTSFAIILSSYTTNAQFAAGQLLQAGGNDISIGYAASPAFADIDNDGDLDLYVGEYYGSIKVFTNTNGVFTAAADLQAGGVDIQLGNYVNPTFADIDNDGDLDLYVGDYGGSIQVFTNTNGVLSAGVNLQADGADISLGYFIDPTFADIDNDGDLDLYVGDYYGNVKVFTNTNGVFTAAADLQADGTDISVVNYGSPIFADINNDGDQDLYVGDYYGGLQVFTNDSGVFTDAGTLQAGGTNIDFDYNTVPTFADIDSDGDLDLYLGDWDGNITFYENTAPIVYAGVLEEKSENLTIYPNPVKSQLYIDVKEEQVTEIKILDLSGKLVQNVLNKYVGSIDVSSLAQGVYIIQVQTENGMSTNQFVKE